MQHTHAYAYAAAALVDQVTRALEQEDETPARTVTEAALAEACRRLGCRGEHPVTWTPEHLLEGQEKLSQDSIIEEYLRARTYLQMRGRVIGRIREGPLASWKWEMDTATREAEGPWLFEPTTGKWDTKGRRLTFSRALARLGIATWRDAINDEGNVKSAAQIKREFGAVNDAREREELKRMQEELEKPEWREMRRVWKKEREKTRTAGVITWEVERRRCITDGKEGEVRFITEIHVAEHARRKGCARQMIERMVGTADVSWTKVSCGPPS